MPRYKQWAVTHVVICHAPHYSLIDDGYPPQAGYTISSVRISNMHTTHVYFHCTQERTPAACRIHSPHRQQHTIRHLPSQRPLQAHAYEKGPYPRASQKSQGP